MADIKSKEERSKNMAAIRSNNTGPEILLRSAVWRNGQRFFTTLGWKRLTGTKLPGSPDLIFPSPRLAVFVDGCFWHGCPLHYNEPGDNQEYWRTKLELNQQRDRLVNAELKNHGWRVLRVWEYDLRRGGHETVAHAIAQLCFPCGVPPETSDLGRTDTE